MIIVRTRRKKTVAIKIVSGQVQISVPKRLPRREIDRIISERSLWIEKQLQRQAEIAKIPAKTYITGETFLYLGKKFQLQLTDDGPDIVKLKKGKLLLTMEPEASPAQRKRYVTRELTQWYVHHAQQRLLERTRYYAELLEVRPRTVVVKAYKARWGSCSSLGDIAYNWKIIMAPAAIVDYLVVHELSHILQHNHSAAFWRCVATFCPEYRESRQWLKLNGSSLEI